MRRGKGYFLTGVLVIFFLLASGIVLAVPGVVTYQGKLTNPDGTIVGNGTYSVTFSIYDVSSGGTALWSETQTVNVVDGIFNVSLGSSTQIPADILNNTALYLGIKVGSDSEMVPRQNITSTFYALKADDADKLGGTDSAEYAHLNDITWQNLSGIPTDIADGDDVGVTSESDPTVLESVKDGISWSEISGRPAGLDDGDDVGITTESDPTVPSSIKDGISWSEISGIPGDIADGDDVGVTSESDPTVPSNLKDGVDWNEISGIPSGFADGVDNVGNLTLPYSGSYTSGQAAFWVTNNGQNGTAVWGLATADPGFGVIGQVNSSGGAGVTGKHYQTGNFGEMGTLNAGVRGVAPGGSVGVRAETATGHAIDAVATNPAGWAGYFSGNMFVNGTFLMSNGSTNTVRIRGMAYGHGSQFDLMDPNGVVRNQLTAASSEMKLFDSGGNVRVQMQGNTGGGYILLMDDDNNTVININAATGTVTTKVLKITGGSDLSEQFDVRGAKRSAVLSPGMVVSIDTKHPGDLIISSTPYDKRVAGIISGAGGIRTGMLMGQKKSIADGAKAIALSGRVYCLADASNGPIEPGDLLTTSATPGHAMKVTDYDKAKGAILGKAMSSLKKGHGLVLMLVTLQ